MSIEAKHKYRFEFLKSDKWQNFRLDVLVNAGGKCFICGDEHFSNDVHHIVYPDVWDETEMRHVAVLCRDCHDKVHFLTDGRDFDSDGHKWKYFHAVTAVLRDMAIKNWELKRQLELTAAAQKADLIRRKREHELVKFHGCRMCKSRDESVKQVNIFTPIEKEWMVNLCPACEWKTKEAIGFAANAVLPEGHYYQIAKKLWSATTSKQVDSIAG